MSTERLTPDPLTPQDKEWEANMLSFVERNEGNGTLGRFVELKEEDIANIYRLML